MENTGNLQQFLEELDGRLASASAEAGRILSSAQEQAGRILSSAQEQKEDIIAQARGEAGRIREAAEHELRLAAAQLRSTVRQQIERMVALQTVGTKVSEVWRDGSFIKELAIKAVEQFGKEGTIVLPDSVEEAFVEQVRAAVGEQFGAGVQVVTDARVRVPLRIVPQGGGYYVSFTDADFEALFTAYLRPKVAKMLFGEE